MLVGQAHGQKDIAAHALSAALRDLVTCNAISGDLDLYVRIASLSSATDTVIDVDYGNAGAAETNDADTWNADYGVVYHLKEVPAGTAPQAKDSTVNAVQVAHDIAGATVEDNTLWGGRCILFDNGPRLRVADNPAIENADRITINRLQHDMAGAPGTGSWAYIVGTYDKDAGANNQRLYLNATRVAQMSDTLPIELNSAALGIGRHVSGIADPFNGHIDEFRISRVRRSGDLERRNGVAAEAERRATCLRMASGTGAAQIRPSAARPVRDPP